ncbi:ATP-binding protein [Actinoplanes subglobosus]|uniref:ATP-binding protein n=1 Tax=Actinoplanes subglobosus TaxID=1547892 RepID=A0ABV8IVK6_9ACTN
MMKARWVTFRVIFIPLVIVVGGIGLSLYFGLESSDKGASIISAAVAVITLAITSYNVWPRQQVSPGPVVVPAQLPAIYPRFTGRKTDLTRLDAQMKQNSVLVSGTAGVGKTALAVHWADRHRGRFPDGQLYINLRGYDPDRPVTAAEALPVLLQGLGVKPDEVPESPDARVTTYRSLIAGRKILLVLDNAATADQVRALLPGPGPARAVVTSRNRLGGNLALAEMTLRRMSDEDCQALLATLLGDRAREDPEALLAIARHCAGLPLALRLAAWRLWDQPGQTLADLAAELAGTSALRALSRTGDPNSAMRTVFSWSYQGLPGEPARRALRLAGLHPGPDFDAHALAALTGDDVATADDLLDELARANLVEARGRGRFALHDLLRLYALDLAEAAGEAEAARDRLAGYYRAASALAATTAYPALRHTLPSFPAGDSVALPGLGDEAAARAWLTAEVPALVRVALTAAEHGRPEVATDLSEVLYRHLDTAGLLTEASLLHSAAAEAAAGPRARGIALHNLAAARFRRSRPDEARDLARRALTESRAAGDDRGQALALMVLGQIVFWHEDRAAALPLYEQAVRHAVAAGDEGLRARLLYNIGEILFDAKDYARAAGAFRATQAVAERLGDAHSEAAAWSGLGSVAAAERRVDDSADLHHQALDRLRRIGDRTMLAGALADSATSLRGLGRLDQARVLYEEALEVDSELDDPGGTALALVGLGETMLAQRRWTEAQRCFERASTLARDTEQPLLAAQAAYGLARASAGRRRRLSARRFARRAHGLYVDHDHPVPAPLESLAGKSTRMRWRRPRR